MIRRSQGQSEPAAVGFLAAVAAAAIDVASTAIEDDSYSTVNAQWQGVRCFEYGKHQLWSFQAGSVGGNIGVRDDVYQMYPTFVVDPL